ncbi:MAG: penicillin-binding transpeptidase domain-containing protein [Acidimicrobiia bacterium]|nr:penicillin-binding transpeptidase domain-containing protein [Acidimicrobiia bacterium]
MNQPLRRLAAALFVAFAVLILDVTYLQVIAGPRYRDDDRNPRVIASRTGKERGLILSADEQVLAESIPDPNDPQRFSRSYPEGELYAHLVGFSSLNFGDDGLELVYAGDLRSKRDLTMSDLLSALLGGDLRPKSIQLTIDHRLQQVVHSALGDQRGSVVAIRPDTGEVLAMVSNPSFDPNLFLGGEAIATRELLLADPSEPLANRSTNRTYPPGSTFKVLVTAAAIESGTAGPDTLLPDPLELELPGTIEVIRNFDRQTCGVGTEVSLQTAFRRSCNTAFGWLGLQLGAEALTVEAEAFGFNQVTPFEIPILNSFFPQPSQFSNDLPAVAQSAIGQRDVRATPFEMALVAAAIANDGIIMQPMLVSHIFDAEGKVISETEPELLQRATSPSTAAIISDLMERVVASGTGTRATVPNVRVAGKTGTAETGIGPPHVWFIGFAPVEQPTIALAVLVESGGEAGENATGGSVAAPIAQEILAYWVQNNG